MQKKIIVLAIAAALTAPALAFAEATVYGQVNPAIDRADDGAVSSSTNANQLNSYGSRVGLKGSESLGGDLSVVWMLEAGVNVDDGTNSDLVNGQFFGRESNVGLKSDGLGTVTVGLQASPYKASTRRLDMFGDTAADNRGALSGGHDESAKNAISYKTPSMGGFTLVAASVFGAETLPQPAAPADKKGSALGLAAMFESGPFYGALAIDNAKFGDPGTGQLGTTADDESNAIMLGGSYSMDAFTVSAEIEQLKDKVAAGTVDVKNTNFYIGGKFNIGSSDAVKVAYTKVGETKVSGTGQVDSATQIAIGYDHSMSRNTSVYALYTKVSNDEFGTTNATSFGADPSVISLGLKHAF